MTEKATFVQTNNSKEFVVQFNPETLTLTKAADWSEKQGDHTLDLPLFEWKGGKAMKLEMTLVFDTWEEGSDVREKTAPIEELAMVYDETHGPPILKFVWGRTWMHRGTAELTWVLSGFNTTYKMFNSEGVPVRAEMKVTLTEWADEDTQKGRIRLQSPDHEKVHRVQPGDTLQSIAAHAYDDPSKWRPIAAANHIEDPFALEPGSVLRVPRIR
jgi:hypothetical protein